jgi:hypothetical protein
VISGVQISGIDGADKQGIESLVASELGGGYFFLFSKHNFLLYPKSKIETEIVNRFKKVKTVKLSVHNKRELVISIETRGTFAKWCNPDMFVRMTVASTSESTVTNCYNLDQDGMAFEQVQVKNESLPTLYKVINRDELGENILDREKFERFNALLDKLAEIQIRPVSVLFRDTGDIEIYNEKGEEFIFSGNDDVVAPVSNLRLLLDSDEFKNQTATSSKQINYIDLRFGKKIFFKLK